MTDLVDLVHGQEEVRFCSALALLLQFDEPGFPILRGLIERVSATWMNPRVPCPFGTVGESTIERVRVSVEEPVEGTVDQEGRYDLVVRFSYAASEASPPMAFVLLIEAKVGAPGIHGTQLSTYREGIQWIREREHAQGTPVFGLLTMDPAKALRNLDDRDVSMVCFHVGWADVAAIVDSRSTDSGTTEDSMRASFCSSVRRWTVKLEDYRAVLEGSSFPFPVLIDALDVLCGRLTSACGATRKMRDPVGAEGPVWVGRKEKGEGEIHDGCYRYGHWWRVGEDWVGLTLAWHYFEKTMDFPSTALKAPAGEAYVPCLELWTSRAGKEKPARLWTQSDLVKLLSEEAMESFAKWLVAGANDEPSLDLEDIEAARDNVR